MRSWFIFTCHFFYCFETHKMALPIQAVIHELSSVNQFRFGRSPRNFWTMGWLAKWVWKITTGKCSLFLCSLNERSALWSSIVTNLTKFYFLFFLGYWTASLKRNTELTEWSGQETTSRGRFYSTLGTFQILVLGCSTDFIYNHDELGSRNSLNLPREIKWSKNTNR